MNKKSLMIIIAVITGIALVLLAVMLLGPSSDNKDVNEFFDAQMAAVKGDNSEVADLGYEMDYSVETLGVLAQSGLTYNQNQSVAANKALDEFTYKILDVTEVEEGVYELKYEIDSYPIVSSQLDYTGYPEKYLTDEELEIYNNKSDYSSEEVSAVIEKLMNEYYAALPSITPDRVVGYVTYVEVEGKIAIQDMSQFKDVVKTILGVSDIPKDPA